MRLLLGICLITIVILGYSYDSSLRVNQSLKNTISTLEKVQLDNLMCANAFDSQFMSGRVTQNQVSQAVENYMVDEYNASINNVEYENNIYNNSKDFIMNIFYTDNDDKKSYKNMVIVTYSSGDNVKMIVSTDIGCILYHQ